MSGRLKQLIACENPCQPFSLEWPLGSVLNVTNKDILITNNISEGNSGGALVDNEGKVIGVVTWEMDYTTDQYNGASILDVACSTILKCQYEFDGKDTWFDYNE